MTSTKRRPLHPALLNAIRLTGAQCVLAGCTVEETIDLCKRTVSDWVAAGKRVLA
jgi:hypothetical protein